MAKGSRWPAKPRAPEEKNEFGKRSAYTAGMRKNFIACLSVFLTVVVFSAKESVGWIATGHTVVALVAWEDLTPKTKAAVTELLKQHPRYQKDLLLNLPDGATPQQTDRYAFGQAATWPDMVRLLTNPMHHDFNHPAWHYIDIPFSNGAPAEDAQPAQGPGPHNIVEALKQCSTEMTDPSVPAKQRAVDICWVEHLVGDIHQPLHAASMYSPDHPDGDKGGNDEEVLRDPPYPSSRMNLHLVWDSLPGDFNSQLMDGYEAIGLRADPQFSREQLKSLIAVKDFMAWANESHQLAVDDAYLNGKLETSVVSKNASDAAKIPGLPPGYLAKAEHLAMHQVALAGYRLADLLNASFDPK